jgi:cbb3-type cytochrome oxidase maturation protein
MGFGLTISIVVFFWALNNGQFTDQKRARYLPLQDTDDSEPVPASRAGRYETMGLFFLAAAGLATSATVLIFALVK